MINLSSKVHNFTLLSILALFVLEFPLNAQNVNGLQGETLGNNKSTNKSSDNSSGLFDQFLELGITQLTKNNKKKPPEDLGSVLSSIRLQNQFLSNQNLFNYQETQIKDQQPKRRISYSIREKDGGFFNINYAFYNHRLEYRKYLIQGNNDNQSNNNYNYSLDIYLNDYKETKYKLGIGPMDYFEDSTEVSFSYFEILTRGTYRVLTRNLSTQNTFLTYLPVENYLLLTSIIPEFQQLPISFIDGTTNVNTKGFGITYGSNTKFWKIFSFYNLFELQFFSIKGNFSTFSPLISTYNISTGTFEQALQIIYINKQLDFNMNMLYELGFSVTVNQIGFKWGAYLTMPLILDTDYLSPKGYIINVYSNRVDISPVETNIQLFYKGDLSNQTKRFSLGLGGITFGLVTKF